MLSSIASWALKKVLAPYFQNLDATELQVSVLKGNIRLTDLFLKPDVLVEQAQLPFHIVSGVVGVLSIDVSWTALFSKPIKVVLDEVTVLVQSTEDVPYDAEKQEQMKQAAKQAILTQFEESLANKSSDSADVFSSKAVFGIVSNLQVEVKRIHLRFEQAGDEHQNHFALGLTLGQLRTYTTDQAWKQVEISPSKTSAHKLVTMEGCGLYLDTRLSNEAMLGLHKTGHRAGMVADMVSPGRLWMLSPIALNAKVKINKKVVEDDGSTPPQFYVDLDLPSLDLRLRRRQYHNLLHYGASLNRLAKQLVVRDIRPKVPVKHNAQVWWRFAYEASFRERRQQLRAWSWAAMAKRRDQRKQYIAVYTKYVTEASKSVKKQLEVLEQPLETDDIMLYRRMARAKIPKKASKSVMGTLSSWWGGTSEEPAPEVDVNKEFQALLANEADYDEAQSMEYVGTMMNACLQRLGIGLINDVDFKQEQYVVKLKLQGVQALIKQRPAAKAMSVDASMQALTANGISDTEKGSYAVMQQSTDALFKLLFETKPLRKSGPPVDTAIGLDLAPLFIDVQPSLAREASRFFLPPTYADLQELNDLSELAADTFGDASEQTLAGLEYAVGTAETTDVRVNLSAPRIRMGLPSEQTMACLVLELGSIAVKSRLEGSREEAENLSMEELQKLVYDKYDIEMRGLTAVVLDANVDWLASDLNTNAPLLAPVGLDLTVAKCLRANDTKLPGMVVDAVLPAVTVNITDYDVIQVAKMAAKFLKGAIDPAAVAPSSQQALPSTARKEKAAVRSDDALKQLADGAEDTTEVAPSGKSRKEQLVQKRHAAASIKLMKLNMEIQELRLNISHKASATAEVQPLLDIRVHRLQAEVLQRTFDMQLSAGLAGFGMAVHPQNKTDYIVYTQPKLCLDHDVPASDIVAGWVKQSEGTERFITLSMSLSDVTNPLLDEEFDATVCTLDVNVRLVAIALQQEPLLELLKTTLPLLKTMGKELAGLDFGAGTGAAAPPGEASVEEQTTTTMPSATRKKPYLDLKLTAKLAGMELSLGQQNKRILVFGLDKITSTVEQGNELLEVAAQLGRVQLKSYAVQDTLYPNLVTMKPDRDLVEVSFKQFTDPLKHDGYDMEVGFVMGQLQFVMVAETLEAVADFAKPFLAVSSDVQLAAEALVPLEGAPDVDDTDLEPEPPANVFNEPSEELNRQPVIKLSVDVAAPSVVIPFKANEQGCFVLDLGQVHAASNKTMLDVQEKEVAYVHYNAALEGLTLFRATSTQTATASQDLSAVEFVDKYGIMMMTALQVGAEIKQPLVEDWDGEGSASTKPLALELAGRNSIEHPRDMFAGASIDKLRLQLGAQDYARIMDLVTHVNESLEVLEIDDAEDADNISIQSESDLDSLSFGSAYTQEGEGDVSRAVPLLNGPASTTMFAYFELGAIELALYNEPSGTSVTEAHNDTYLLTQGSFLGLSGSFETDNEEEAALAAHLQLQSIELMDNRHHEQKNFFAKVLATANAQGDDDEACLELELTGTRQSVTYVTSEEVNLTSPEWQEQLSQHGSLQHLYLQQAAPRGVNVAVVEYGKYSEAEASLAALREDDRVTDARFGPAMLAKADAKFRGLDLVLAPDYIAALLEFVLAPFVADADLLAEVDAMESESQPTATATSAEPRVVVKDMLSEDQAYLMLPTMMERLHAQARIEHPTIIVVEDPYDEHTRALSFDFVVKVDFQSSQDVMHVFAAISEATLVSQLWNKPATQMQVLEPLDLTLQYRESDDTIKAHTLMDSVAINLAYADVQFVTLFAQKISEPFEALTSGKSSTPTELPPGAIPAIKWDQLPVPVNHKRHRRAAKVVQATVGSTKQEALEARIPFVNITLINTMHQQLSPLLTLSASLDLTLSNWSRAISGEAAVSVAAAMLDPRFTAWEPLLVGGDANSQQAQPYQLQAQISSDEVKKVDMGAVSIARESGHRRLKLDDRTGETARALLTADSTFWAAKPRKSRDACKVVFDMTSTVKLKRFLFYGLGLADHAPRTSSLHVADSLKGPWKHVCDIASPNGLGVMNSPEFSATGRYWRWAIKRCHGSNHNPYVERVEFEKAGGGISVRCDAVERLDLTVTSNVVSRLVSISTEWLADLSQLREARNATSSGIPTRIGLYQLSNQTGHPVAYQAAPHYDAHQARKQRVDIGQAQVFDLETEHDISLVASESELTNLTNVKEEKPIRNIVAFNASKKQYAPKGYVTIEKNVNEDTKDDVIYLAYTTEGDEEPITDVFILWNGFRGTGNDPKVGAPERIPSDWDVVPMDLNADRDHLRRVKLVFRRGQGAPIVGLTILFCEEGDRNEVLPEGYHFIPKQLNKGHRSNSIKPHLAYKRAPAVDILSQPVLRDPSAPVPITDIRVISLRKATKDSLPCPDESINNWTTLSDDKGIINLSAKSGGNATYIMYARDPSRPPVTGLALYGSAEKKVHPDWTTDGVDINEKSKAKTLRLYVQHSPGAAPVTNLMTVVGDKKIPEVFIVSPDLNTWIRDLFRNTSLYLAYTIGTRNPESFTVKSVQSHRKATRAKSIRAQRDSASTERSAVRPELKAIEYLQSGSKSGAISFEVKGWLPLENVNIDRPGESTYLMQKIGLDRYDRITVHVLIRNDVKTIILRSPLHCVNDFDIPLHVACHSHLTEDKVHATLQPGDEFSPPLGSLDDPPAGAHVQPLYRFWSPVKERHFVSNNPADALKLHSSFIVEAILGYVFISPFEGTVPLWASRCDTHRTRYYVFTNRSESDRKKDNPKSHFKPRSEEELRKNGNQIVGYIYTEPTPETTPLYQYAAKDLDDNLPTTEKHEVTFKFSEFRHFLHRKAGYAHRTTEGHILKHPGLLRVKPAEGDYEWSHETRNLHCSRKPARRILNCFPQDARGATQFDKAPQFACYMDPMNGEICSSFRLRPPVRLRNMLPCPISLAVLDHKDAVPKAYVSLLSGNYHTADQLQSGSKFCLRFSFAAERHKDVSLEESLAMPVPEELWSSGCTIDLDNVHKKSELADLYASIHWIDPMDNSTKLLKLGIHVERVHGSFGPVTMTVFCPYQIVNHSRLGLNLRTTTAETVGLFRVTQPADLRALQADPYPESVELFSPMTGAEETVVETMEGLVSGPFSLLAAPPLAVIPLFHKSDVKQKKPVHELSLRWEWGDADNRTRRFILEPMFEFINKTPVPLLLAKVKKPEEKPSKEHTHTLKAGVTMPYNDALGSQLWKIKLAAIDVWSSPFSGHKHPASLNTVHHLKLGEGDQFTAIQVECVEFQNRHLVTFSLAADIPPFRIENFSSQAITFSQLQFEADSTYHLDAGTTMAYALDHPLLPADRKDDKKGKPIKTPTLSFNLRDGGSKPAVVGLDVDKPKFLKQGDSDVAVVTVIPDNDGSICFLITDSIADLRNLFGLSLDIDNKESNDERLLFEMALVLPDGIGISMISDRDGYAGEFVYISVLGIRVSYTDTSEYLKLAANVERLQVDYQQPNAEYPVAVYAEQEELKDDDPQRSSVFATTFIQRKGDIGVGRAFDYIEYFSMRLLPLSVFIDGALGADAMNFAKIFELLPEGEASVPEHEAPLFWDSVEIHPLEIHATVTDTDEIMEELPLYLRSLGVSFLNLNNVAFKVPAVSLDELYMTSTQLSTRVTELFVDKLVNFLLVQGVFRAVGSLQLIGDPIGSFGSVAGGVKSLFYEPYKGLVRGPADFGKGVGKGMTALTSGVVGGVTGAGAKVTGAVGSGLANMMDDKYTADRARDMQRRPTNAGAGMATGGKRFAKGLLSGITGVVTAPVQGARSGGFFGALKGTAQGISGVVLKPVGGAVDMVSSTFAGIEAQVNQKQAVTRVRAPRVVRHDGYVTSYSTHLALGLGMVSAVDELFDLLGETRYMGHSQELLGDSRESASSLDASSSSGSGSKKPEKIRFVFVTDQLLVVATKQKGHYKVKQTVDAQRVVGYRSIDAGLELVLSDNSAVLLPGDQRVKKELAGLLRRVLQLHQRKPFTDPDVESVFVNDHEELEMDVAVWEYQRKFDRKWRARMLAVDRARCWTYVDNSAGFDLQELVTPPSGWEWCDEWKMASKQATANEDGWEYAKSLAANFRPIKDHTVLRRRLWHRRATRVLSDC
eukprot:m.292217 g.292217  ORF g.292217 m.292217 type:complete len:4111 (-) comp17825_c0_seq1:1128-13460(-)